MRRSSQSILNAIVCDVFVTAAPTSALKGEPKRTLALSENGLILAQLRPSATNRLIRTPLQNPWV